MNEVDLLNVMKRASESARKANQPADIMFGTVVSASPIKIQVSQKLTLSSMQLVVPRSLTKYTLSMTYDFGCSETEEHTHELKGTTEVTIDNSLQTGDRVVLIKQDGGQKYFVMDKVVSE